MKASIKQISEITGFSPATISNALNHKKGVNQKTAERIFQVDNAKKAWKYAIFRAFSIPKILSGLFGFDGI